MCGLAGISLRRGQTIGRSAFNVLQNALRHRGPDGEGQYNGDGVALVHTRLSIIDLETGNQPISAGQGPVLVANAEIYNDLALRSELGADTYATKSDCESALRLYLRDGPKFADGLRGMYAIAIHDPGRNCLVLARDPFGIKPLYYAEIDQGLAFASEPQALIAAGLVAPDVDPVARSQVLALQYSIGRETPIRGIHRVLPGETLVIRDGEIIDRLRRQALPRERRNQASIDDALMAFSSAWRDSVDVHQRADVPYGMFLSGGLDSSAVLAIMAQLNSSPVLAFTAAFPGTAVHDERETARRVAQHFGARHVEIEVTADDFWRRLPAIAAAVDDPTADYAVIPTYLLAERARRDVKVVLTGEGGDELLAGYGRYRAALRPWPFRRKPWRSGLLDGLGLLSENRHQWRAGIAALESDAAQTGFSGLRAAQAVDCAAWLPNDLLTKLDRCLMTHGVEGRVPFLDPIVSDAVFSLPDRFKIAKGRGKWLLRHWTAKHVPVIDAFAAKRGFTVPVGSWIAAQGARLGPVLAAHPAIAEICRAGRVIELCKDGKAARYGHALWVLLFYALWHNRHILGHDASGDVFDALAAGNR
ncbi:MAG: asparagine synthase (glutamine-hydrolyzing) [Rhodobacteraceae bacterium]|nr:asparagine synthase (glutamine-hydrolyzing) [Paracoccaceae bacterium]